MSSYPPAPPPAYGPPPGGKPRLRGRIPLRLALIFGLIGLALAVVGIVVLVKSPIGKVDDFARAPIDGQTHTVELTRTGNYVGYYEEPGLDTSKSRTPTFTLALVDASGTAVAVRKYSNTTTLSYEYGGHNGLAVAKFSITKAGTYTVRGEGTDVPADAKIAFGESVAHGLIAGVLLFIGGLALIVTAIILLIVGLVKRGRHKKALTAYPYGAPPPPYYPPQPGFGGPPPGGAGPSLSKG